MLEVRGNLMILYRRITANRYKVFGNVDSELANRLLFCCEKKSIGLRSASENEQYI